MMPEYDLLQADLKSLGIIAEVDWMTCKLGPRGTNNFAVKVTFALTEDMNLYKLVGKFPKVAMEVKK